MKKLWLTFVLLTGLLLTQSAQANNQSNHRFFNKLTGTYAAEINANGATITALYSFNQGGTMSEADNPGFDPNFGDLALSPGLGSWRKVGRNSYSATYRKLGYDTQGSLQQIYTTSMQLSFNRDRQLTGVLSIQISTPDGTILGELEGLNLTATKF